MELSQDTELGLREVLITTHLPFIQIPGRTEWSDGWKLSIQGKTIDDVIYLLRTLIPFMDVTGASHKFGTQLLIDQNSEQSTKLLTIYIPNGVDPVSYATLLAPLLINYEGAKGIPDKIGYTKFSEAIYYRNDRDANGNYVYPDGRVLKKGE